jgi:hypothetical protein
MKLTFLGGNIYRLNIDENNKVEGDGFSLSIILNNQLNNVNSEEEKVKIRNILEELSE